MNFSEGRKAWSAHEITRVTVRELEKSRQHALERVLACAAGSTDPNVRYAMARYEALGEALEEIQKGDIGDE
jgi:hypothetical protein